MTAGVFLRIDAVEERDNYCNEQGLVELDGTTDVARIKNGKGGGDVFGLANQGAGSFKAIDIAQTVHDSFMGPVFYDNLDGYLHACNIWVELSMGHSRSLHFSDTDIPNLATAATVATHC